MDGAPYSPRTVEEIFADFKGRRFAIVKALTSDVEEFFQQCDPEKDNQCLYGYPNGEWQVSEPAEDVPTELPEPALGINFARDGLEEKEWLALVAVHSDVWLLSVAFFIAARFGLGKTDRKRLFNLIHELPTVFEVVRGETQKQSNRSSSSSSTKPKSNSKGKLVKVSQLKYEEDDEDDLKEQEEEEEEEEEDEDEEEEEEEDEDDESETQCGACGEVYSPEEFWICCDLCEKWYHGKCVKITPARAEHIKQYKCPICSHKRGRA